MKHIESSPLMTLDGRRCSANCMELCIDTDNRHA